MSYWCDDRALALEQARLDAAQAEVKKRLDEKDKSSYSKLNSNESGDKP